MNEVWKPVKGYEGLYEISNYGRVKSLPRNTTKGGLMKLYVNPRNGYVYVCLCKNNHTQQKRVHVAVIEAFTDFVSHGFNSETVIDHIDCNKQNNCLWNLELVSQKENDRRSRENHLQKIIGIKVIDLDTKQIFESYTDAARAVGGKKGVMVTRVCDGKRSHYRNHRFARLGDYENKTIPEYTGKTKRKASEMLWV